MLIVKVIIGILLGLIILSLGAGLFSVLSDRENSNRTVKLLTVRIVLSIVTFIFIGWVLMRGLSGGIERLALIGMPILCLFAMTLMIRILTLPPAPIHNFRSYLRPARAARLKFLAVFDLHDARHNPPQGFYVSM